MVADLHAQWDPSVTCSDACTYGIGVCQRQLPADIVGAVGRCNERWRYKTQNSIAARQHAVSLSSADHVTVDESSLQHIRTFDEVPHEWMDINAWSVLHVGTVSKSEHITRTEGRALVWGVAHNHRTSHSGALRQLYLVDNLSLCLGACKGRSGTPVLAPTLSFIAAVSLATGNRIICRWLPSEWNVAEKPSRPNGGGPVSATVHSAVALPSPSAKFRLWLS